MRLNRTLAACVLFACACSKPEEPAAPASSSVALPAETAVRTPPAATPPVAAPSKGAVADIGWDVPSAWKTVPNASAMRKATYRVTKVAGDPDDAEMSVTQVGGGVDANIERWAGQFEAKAGAPAQKAKRDEKTMGPLKITVAELAGTYTGGGGMMAMPGAPAAGPKTGYALLAAIVEGTDPPYFFKLVGPEKTVRAARPDFDKLVASMKPR